MHVLVIAGHIRVLTVDSVSLVNSMAAQNVVANQQGVGVSVIQAGTLDILRFPNQITHK